MQTAHRKDAQPGFRWIHRGCLDDLLEQLRHGTRLASNPFVGKVQPGERVPLVRGVLLDERQAELDGEREGRPVVQQWYGVHKLDSLVAVAAFAAA